jgi:DNA polymerase III delta prime subunit
MKEKLDIHKNIIEKLDYFLQEQKIPNIIFHGPSGSGKRTLVYSFIDKIYDNNILKNKYVMFVNCAHCKGIKYIREDLKFFAKTNINYNGNFFKTIILSNADKLTIDAQSALRRCIELFSHTTRFIIIIEDKYKLLKPILSRFSEIYVPHPYINKSYNNLYQYNLELIENNSTTINYLKKNLINIDTPIKIVSLSTKLYNKSICGLDLINYIYTTYKNNIDKYELLITIQKVKKELRNEELFILFILNSMFFRSESYLENILSM